MASPCLKAPEHNWPILDCDKTQSPFVIGLFCGNSIPSSVWSI